MSSNRGVKYVDLRVYSIDQYWGELLTPNVQAFIASETPLTVFNAALSTWHLIDWTWHQRHSNNDDGETLPAYQGRMLAACPDLNTIRDVAESGKHRLLNRPTVTTSHITPLSVSRPTPTIYVFQSYDPMVTNFGIGEAFGELLKRVIEFWRIELKEYNLPSPFDHA